MAAMPVHVTNPLMITARRERRIQAVPAPLRPAVRGFAEALLVQRESAESLGLRPNRLKTIEVRLDTVRDLALYAHARGHTTWAALSVTDLEAFLARNPARRASWLAGLRQFFSHVHRTGVVLHNATALLDAPQSRGFRGATLTLAEQRVLYQRWSGSRDVHPHEAFVGLAALLHAATTTELRLLTLDQLSAARGTVRLPGRLIDIELDTATWSALEGCLGYRASLRTDNPHVLVTRLTRISTGVERTRGLPQPPGFATHGQPACACDPADQNQHRPSRRGAHPRQSGPGWSAASQPAFDTAAHPRWRTRHQAAHRSTRHVLCRRCPLSVARNSEPDVTHRLFPRGCPQARCAVPLILDRCQFLPLDWGGGLVPEFIRGPE